MRFARCVYIFACVMAYVSRTEAAPPEVSANLDAARALFEEAVELKASDPNRACTLFQESLRLVVRASTWAQIGECRRRAGKFVAAWDAYQQALELFRREPNDYHPKLVTDVQAGLDQIPTLELRVVPNPEELRVSLDGKLLSAAQLGARIPIELGAHEIVVNAPRFRTHSQQVEIDAVKTWAISISLQPDLRATASEPAHPGQRKQSAQPRLDQPVKTESLAARRTAAQVMLGTGAAGLAVAGVLGLRTLALVDDSNRYCQYSDGSCDPTGVELRRQASDMQTAGFIVAGTSGLLLSTAIVLLFTASDTSSQKAQVGIFSGRSRAGVWSRVAW